MVGVDHSDPHRGLDRDPRLRAVAFEGGPHPLEQSPSAIGVLQLPDGEACKAWLNRLNDGPTRARASHHQESAPLSRAAITPVVEHGIPLLEQGRAFVTTYEQLVDAPGRTLGAIAEFAGLDADAVIGRGLDRNYMSMSTSTFDPGDVDLRHLADRARSLLGPLAPYLASGTA
jgi:hypothetical protein